MAIRALTLDQVSPEILLLMNAQKRLEDGMEEEALQFFTDAVPQLPVDIVQNIYYQVWVLSNSPTGNAHFGEEVMFNRFSFPQQNSTQIKAEAIRNAICTYCEQTIVDFPKALEERFICTISQEVMEKPIVTSNGQSYEAKEIEKWKIEGMKNGKWTKMQDPNTATEVSTTVYPNYALESTIEVYEEYKPKLTNVTVIIQNNFQEVTQLRQEKSTLMQMCGRVVEEMQRLGTQMQQMQSEIREIKGALKEKELKIQEKNSEIAALTEELRSQKNESKAEKQRIEQDALAEKQRLEHTIQRQREESQAQTQRHDEEIRRQEEESRTQNQVQQNIIQRHNGELQSQRNAFNQQHQAQNQVIQTQQQQNHILNEQLNASRTENTRYRQREESEKVDPVLCFWKTVRSWVYG